MKIGILTQPLTNNYGGILQNYALQTILRKLGHSPVTINISRPLATRKHNLRWLLSIAKRAAQIYLQDKRDEILFVNPYNLTDWLNIPQKHQQRFIKKYIDVEEVGHGPLNSSNDNYDGYIVGSDQVWRPIFTTYMPNYFLDFVNNQNAIKLAYAASFGVDSWEMSPEQTPLMAHLAHNFKGISVREHSGINLCRNYLKVEAIQVLDPTLLLEAQNYRSLFEPDYTQQKYIAVYVLDLSSSITQMISSVAQHFGLPLKYIGKADRNGIPSIESWLSDIDNAEYVITDSFHGSVFSIIFEKQFVALGNVSRGMSRFESLFNEVGLKHRMATNSDAIIKSLKNPIDYAAIMKSLIPLRQYSIDFINQHLTN